MFWNQYVDLQHFQLMGDTVKHLWIDSIYIVSALQEL